MNYEEDVRIDETALDLEWLEQPSLMMQYGKMMAQANRELDELKETLNLVRAELDKAIRTNPEAYGIEKITETVVQNTIIQQTKYQEAQQEVLDAIYESKVASVAVQAIDQRKTALENLVRLHGQQYFAGPRIPRDLEKEREYRQESANKKVQMKRNK